MFRKVLATTVLLAGCGGALPEAPRTHLTSRSAQVVLGTIEPARPEVFMLMARDAHTGQGFFLCSATLIGARTLLTAAHCLSCYTDPTSIEATNQQHPLDYERGLEPWLVTVPATAWRRHPDFVVDCTGGGISGPDIGLVQLASPPAVSPREWADSIPANAIGRSVRLIGYGAANGVLAGTGRRRSGTDSIHALTATAINTSGSPSTTCFGDSGGPYLLSYPDGIERVVAATSKGSSDCTGGGIGARVDVAADFIRTTLAEFDPDPCAADGVCSAACTDKASDPDCPESCAPNGLCSAAGTCPTRDPDCAPLGSPCIAAAQCAGGRCVRDPQHPDGYCSRACAGDQDCGGTLVCDGTVCRHPQLPVVAIGSPCDAAVEACADNGLCVQLGGGAPTCRAECDVTADCRSGACVLDAGVAGTGICVQPLTSPDAGSGGSQGHSAPSGCSAAPGNVPAALVLLLAAWVSSLPRVRRQAPRSSGGRPGSSR